MAEQALRSELGEERAGRPWLVPTAAGALAAALHVLTATTPGFALFRDELYFLACGQHLAFGYVDQPPFIALVARTAHALFGASMVGLRLFPALAAGGVVALAALLARELGGSRRAEVLAALAVAFAPVHLANLGLLTMNAFDVLAWAAAFYVLARILGRGEERGWMAFGLVAGVGLENKLSMAFLGAGVAVGLVATARGRDELRRRWVWLGALVALALAVPFAAWQAAHGWPMRDLIAATAQKNVRGGPWGFLAEQIIHIGPVSVALWLVGAAWLAAGRDARLFRPLAVAVAVVLAILLSDPFAKAYYLAPAHALLLAAGAVAVARATEAAGRRWIVPAWASLAAAGGLVALPLTKPLLPAERFVAYARALGVSPRAEERHERSRLPQFFADRLGWPDLAAAVADVHGALPARERAVACIYVDNYGEAGAIDFYGAGRGLPPALSGHNNYWIWGPRGCSGDVVIVLTGDREALDQVFESVTEVGSFLCGDCMPYENGKRLYVARHIKRPLAELWPKLERIM